MLRQATILDFYTIKDFVTRCITETKQKEVLSTDMVTSELIQIYYDDPTKVFFVIEEDAKVIGFIACELSVFEGTKTKVAREAAIYIISEYRNKGYAHTLRSALEDWGKSLDADLVNINLSKEDADLTKAGYWKHEVVYFKKLK